MTLKKSFFSYVKEQMSSRFWMFLFEFLLYFTFISLPINYLIFESEKENILEFYVPSSFFLTLIVALFSASNIFGYLFSKNECIFYHSLPIKRGKLFLERYMTGILYFLAAFFINYLFIWIVAMTKGVYIDEVKMLSILFKNIITYLIIYNSAIFAITISNSFLNSGFNNLIVIALPLLIYQVIRTLEYRYFSSSIINYIFDFSKLSPVMLSSMHLDDSAIFETYAHNWMMIFFFIVVLFVVDYILFIKRKSEHGEMGCSYRYINNVLKVLSQSMLALTIAITVGNDNLYLYLAMSSIAMYAIFELITSLDVKNIIRNIKLGIAALALSLFIMFGFQSNLFHLNFSLPKADIVKNVYMDVIGAENNIMMFKHFSRTINRYRQKDDIKYKEILDKYIDNTELEIQFLNEVIANSKRVYFHQYDDKMAQYRVNLQLKDNRDARVTYVISIDTLNQISKKYDNEANLKAIFQYDMFLEAMRSEHTDVILEIQEKYYIIKSEQDLNKLFDTYIEDYLKIGDEVIIPIESQDATTESFKGMQTHTEFFSYEAPERYSEFVLYISDHIDPDNPIHKRGLKDEDMYFYDYDRIHRSKFSYHNKYKNTIELLENYKK